ncbi:MAG TPA: chemotaxis protein CheW [Vicinamibacterales bacterium]|nr:chemotaxis protein CheW [Vicinamibacterales bacterium]
MNAGNYILFTVAGTSYALPSQDVAHVEMIEQITKVPNAPAFVDGVVFSRGQVVPAINMRARFGFDRAPLDVSSRLLVVNSKGRSVGLLVDACREFMTVPPSAIHPPGEALSGLSAQYVDGVATVNDRLIVLLGLDRLLGTTEHAVASGA